MPWLLFGITASAALVVGIAISLAIGSWWLVPAALLVHALGFALVIGLTGRLMQQTSKPDPVTEARIDEEGVRPVREHAEPGPNGRPEDEPHKANPVI